MGVARQRHYRLCHCVGSFTELTCSLANRQPLFLPYHEDMCGLHLPTMLSVSGFRLSLPTFDIAYIVAARLGRDS